MFYEVWYNNDRTGAFEFMHVVADNEKEAGRFVETRKGEPEQIGRIERCFNCGEKTSDEELAIYHKYARCEDCRRKYDETMERARYYESFDDDDY